MSAEAGGADHPAGAPAQEAAPPQLCYLGLGGNLGDRLRHLSRALRAVAALDGVRVLRTSSLYVSAPQYVRDQPPFLNAVAELSLTAARLADLQGLLADLKKIESDVGREPGVRRGPRVVDVDVIAVGNVQLSATSGPYPLEVPHALMHERDFVLVPMSELCPDWRHPSLEGKPSLTDLLSGLRLGSGAAAPGASVEAWPFQVMPGAGGLHGRSEGLLWRQGEQTLVMGVLNVTPDSFSDGGDHVKLEDAVAAAKEMVGAGAHIIDVGGESTRPGAAEVPHEMEIGRVVPIIRAIRSEGLNVTVSVDTRKAVVARAAVEAGADWINDVSGGEFDPDMLPTAAELMAPIVLMHMRGLPENMNSARHYELLLSEVTEHLAARRRAAEEAGVPSWNILLDPGIGFAKGMDHNLQLLRNCASLVQSLRPSPVLVGASRKRFLGTILGEPDAKKRVFGNAATVAASVAGLADIVRVHEVREMAQTARVCDCIYRNCVAGAAPGVK